MANSRRPRPLQSFASVLAAFGLLPFVLTTTAGCGDTNAAIQRLADARHLSADLYVEFVRASGATDRAVMADTDQASLAFAQEAEEASQAVQHDVDALTPLLLTLNYPEEQRLLDAVITQFGSYRELDRRIRELAVQNTNLKAQQLSFGAGQEAADAFASTLRGVVATRESDAWHVRALVATAVAAVREIQALQAPHIANADDAVMTRLEERMGAAEADARRALAALRPIVASTSASRLDAATAALDKLMAVNAQLIGLSRQNTNVRSLALALDEKRALTTACEQRVRALRDALAKRGYPAGR